MNLPEHVVYVIGGHNTGKTTVIEEILPRLKEKGFKIGVVKDIHAEDFTLDSEGKDTWRLAEIGASMVCARGLEETDFLTREKMDLKEILNYFDSDLIIAEGFKEKTGNKILIGKNWGEIAEFLDNATERDKVLAIGGPVAKDSSKKGHDLQDAIFLSDETAFDKVVTLLEPIAKRGQLHRNRLQMPLQELNCSLSMDGEEVRMKPYVIDTLKNIVVGTIASLHWNTWDPVTKIEMAIKNDGTNDDIKWKLDVKVNEKVLKMKDFVQDSINATILGYIGSLQLPDNKQINEFNEIYIEIK